MADDTREITLVGTHTAYGTTYGPGKVTLPSHLADVLERMDVPHRERAEAERETRKADRERAKAAAERQAARAKDGGGA